MSETFPYSKYADRDINLNPIKKSYTDSIIGYYMPSIMRKAGLVIMFKSGSPRIRI